LENVYEQPEETPFMQRVGKFFDFIEKFLLGGEKK